MVTTDFLSDYYERFLWPQAQAFGYRERPSDLRDWFTLHTDMAWVREKRIAAKPRKLKVAGTFVCPPHRQAGLASFRQKVLSGASLNSHLSERTENPMPDGLLSDWGIYHFHLGINRYSKNHRFVDRTEELLFAWVDDAFVYNIAIGDHRSFEDFGLLETLCRSWPHLLDRYQLSHALPAGGGRPGRKELFRARGCLSLGVEIDGKVFMSPGGGVATDGTPMRSQMTASREREVVLALEKWVRENAELEFQKQGYSIDGSLELRLHLENGRAFAESEKHMARLRIPPFE